MKDSRKRPTNSAPSSGLPSGLSSGLSSGPISGPISVPIPVSIPPTIAANLQTRYGIEHVVPVEPGMSGASVYHCQSTMGQRYALKHWPTGTSQTRIAEVHHVMSVVRQGGCEWVPEIFRLDDSSPLATNQSTAENGSWELSQWMPGQPIDRVVSLGCVERGAAAIAQFHAAALRLGGKSQPPPAAISRLQRIDELHSMLPHGLATDPSLRLPPRLAEAVQNAQLILRENWRGAAERISRWMKQCSQRSMITQYVLRDVHRDHVLFEAEQVSGLIDFDAIRIDSPATDLARWAGSLLALDRDGPAVVIGDDDERIWEAVLAGFLHGSPSSHRAHAEEWIQVAKHLHAATTWISLANWVVWLLVDRRSFPAGEDRVRQRILEWTRLSAQDVSAQGGSAHDVRRIRD